MKTINLDLTDSAILLSAISQYIEHGVCPASEKPPPRLLEDVKLQVKLPGGFEVVWQGRVIHLLSPESFIVELSPKPGVAWLKSLATKSKPVEAASAQPKVLTLEDVGRAALEAVSQSSREKTNPKVEIPVLPDPVEPIRETQPHTSSTGHDSGEFSTEITASTFGGEVTGTAFRTGASEMTSPELLFEPLPPEHVTKELPVDPVGTGPVWAAEVAAQSGSTWADANRSSGSWPVGLALEKTGEFLSEKTGPALPVGASASPENPDLTLRIAQSSQEEKRQLARHGGRAARRVLIQDADPGLQVLVILNPEVGLEEIEEYSLIPTLSQDAIRHLVQNKSWMNSRQVVFNLTRNPSTPLDFAAAMVTRLGPTEWKFLIQAPGIRTAVAAVARKMLVKKGA